MPAYPQYPAQRTATQPLAYPPVQRAYSTLAGYQQPVASMTSMPPAIAQQLGASDSRQYGMYQVGQPYQPGQVMGRPLDSFRTRLAAPPAAPAGVPPQYMVYRMPDGSQPADPQQALHTIAEDEADEEPQEEPHAELQEEPQASQDEEPSASASPARQPSDAEAEGLRVEIPATRSRSDAGLLRRSARSGQSTPATARTNQTDPSAAKPARRLPPAVNTSARLANPLNEPGPQTAMLLEMAQNLPSPSTFYPQIYQQNENFSPLEFGTTPIIGHQQQSAFQWPVPGSVAGTRAPHQPSPLKRSVEKGASPGPSTNAATDLPSPRKRTRTSQPT
ncbi:hypothetical protein EC988_004496 [Linderina pennispora]|nr:hypothetical protein EC988_004496 [Linderina pennispora]